MSRPSSAIWSMRALPFEPAGVLVQQAGKGKIYPQHDERRNSRVPRHPVHAIARDASDIIKRKPDMLRKVAQVFTEATEDSQDRSASAA